MNQKLLLNLIAVPTVATSLVTMLVIPSIATTRSTFKPLVQGISTEAQASCDIPANSGLKPLVRRHTKGEILVASANLSGEHPMLDFSAAESDAAVTLFGCDCLACINVLRQLRSNPSLRGGQGHCWSSLQQRRLSPQAVRGVLQELEIEDS